MNKKKITEEKYIELSNNLGILFSDSEKKISTFIKNRKQYPVIFIIGAPRSGTTYTLQLLQKSGITVPTNLLARHYKAPLTGLFLSQIINSLHPDFSQNLISKYGKTEHMLDVNEFYFFWRLFFKKNVDQNIDIKDIESLFKGKDFKNTLINFTKLSENPFALKGLMFNYHIDFLNKLLPDSIFIYTKRNLFDNAKSLLETRKKIFGNINHYYSFENSDFNRLKNLNPYMQVLTQIININKKLDESLYKIDNNRIIHFEDFKINVKNLKVFKSRIKIDINFSDSGTNIMKKKTNLSKEEILNLKYNYNLIKDK